MIELKNLNLSEIFTEKNTQKWESKYPIFLNGNVKQWVRDRVELYQNKGKNASNFPVTSILKHLQDYMNHYEIENVDDLLTEDIDNRSLRVQRYLVELLNVGVNETSVKNAIQANVRSFYTNRGLPLKKTTLPSVGAGVNEDEYIFSRESLKLFQARLERAEYRVIFKLMALTGLRVGDVLEDNGLTNGKYKIQKYKDHYYVKNFRTMKEGVSINFVFLPHELANLMMAAYQVSDLTKLDLTKVFMTKMGNRIRKRDFLSVIKSVGNKLGITENVKTHALRKYFSSAIAICEGCPDKFREHLLGHKQQLDQYLTNMKQISFAYKEWLKIERLVCIDCEIYDATNEEVLKLKEENIRLKQQIEMLLEGKIETDDKIKFIMRHIGIAETPLGKQIGFKLDPDKEE